MYRFSSASNAFHGFARRVAGNGCRPAFSDIRFDSGGRTFLQPTSGKARGRILLGFFNSLLEAEVDLILVGGLAAVIQGAPFTTLKEQESPFPQVLCNLQVT